jgi:hypothetical protein
VYEATFLGSACRVPLVQFKGKQVVASLLVTLLLGAPSAEEMEQFKRHFTAGESLFEKNEFGAAIWHFHKAEMISPTPEVAYDLAKCHERVNDVAYAVYYYRLYLKRAPTASDALEVAERVGNALNKAEAEGKGLLELDTYAGGSLSIAGRTFPSAPAVLFLAPGEYEVNAQFPSGPKKMGVQVRIGKTTSLAFEPLPPPLFSATPSLRPEVFSKGPSKPLSGKRIGAFGLWGAGVAAVAVGSIFGVMSNGEAGRLKTQTLRVSQAQEIAASANSKAAIANSLWVTGGLALAGGTALFVFSLPEPGMK